MHTGYQESYVRLEGKAGKEEDGYEDKQDKFEEYGEEDDDGGAEAGKKKNGMHGKAGSKRVRGSGGRGGGVWPKVRKVYNMQRRFPAWQTFRHVAKLTKDLALFLSRFMFFN